MSEVIQRLQGEAARLRMLERTQEHLQAQELIEVIAEFYGDRLFLEESPSLVTSRYHLDFNFEPLIFKHALIELATNSDRVAGALVHEALHLNNYVDGWPTGIRLYIPDELEEHASVLADYCLKVLNVVGHEINIEPFIRLGLKKEHFLTKEESVPNYKWVAKQSIKHPDYVQTISFAWWCLEYFRHYISIPHGRGEIARRAAKQAIKHGSTVHRQLPEATSKLKEWLGAGVFRNQPSYAQQVNELLSIMGLPQFDIWATLKRLENGLIVAVAQTY